MRQGRADERDIDYEWVADDRRLREIVDEASTTPAYAIDTEFHRERTYWAHLGLVQLGWRPRPAGNHSVPSESLGGYPVALIDPLETNIGLLAGLLESDSLAVIHASDQDLEILERETGVLPGRIFDTQLAAGFCGFGTPSLGNLLSATIGIKLPKADRLTDWMQRPLKSAERVYAASDVAYLLDVYDYLRDRLDESGRTEWAAEEAEEFRVRPREPQVPEAAWWRIKGGRQLRGDARGVAQELTAWRERTAAERDQPVRMVLSDLAILALAQRPARDAAGLRKVRGIDGRHLRKGADVEILDAIRRGSDLSKPDLCLPKATRQAAIPRPLSALCSAYVAQVADDNDLDPALLATRDDISAFLREDPDAGLHHGWRYELAGAGLERLVKGLAVLQVGDSRHVTLRDV